jgi:hypothetical protein
MDYEFTLVLELDINHNAIATKDRTSLFTGLSAFRITEQTGCHVLDWCKQGIQGVQGDLLLEKINDCKSLPELLQLYYGHPSPKPSVKNAFTKRRNELERKEADDLVKQQQQVQ